MFYLLIGFLMLIGLFVLHLSCAVYAAVRAAHGEPYRYPLTIDIIKPENRSNIDPESM